MYCVYVCHDSCNGKYMTVISCSVTNTFYGNSFNKCFFGRGLQKNCLSKYISLSVAQWLWHPLL